ncbi:hypothetical protein AHAS_Ahas09G0147900 [Arachis hypogaea]
MACHAFDTKWLACHTHDLVLCIGVPCLVAQVARRTCHANPWCHAHLHAWISLLDFSTGMPRLAPGMLRQCIFMAFALKWHANFTRPTSCLSSSHF